MYCKVFASLYQGTLRGQSNEILVFTNLLAHSDKDGFVDKHFRAIAEETGLDLEEVKQAIINLESPDAESRSPEEEGARIVRLDEHRVWGWRIVNYVKYRALRNMDDRREQNRIAQEKWRKSHVSKNNKNKPRSAEVSHCHAQSAHADADADVHVNGTLPLGGGLGEPTQKRRFAPSPVGFEEFWSELHKDNRKYKGRAREAWKKAIKNGATDQQILSAVSEFNRNEKKRRQQNDYRATHPATWLNGGGFEDHEVIKENTNGGSWIDKSIYG